MAILTKKVETYKCNACGHEWRSRDDEKPIRCSKCKSPYWNEDRKNGK